VKKVSNQFNLLIAQEGHSAMVSVSASEFPRKGFAQQDFLADGAMGHL